MARPQAVLPGEEETAAMLPGKGKKAAASSWRLGGFGLGGWGPRELLGAGATLPFKQHYCPEEEAGYFSRWFFVYVDGLMHAGAKKHLEQQDLWDLAHCDKAERVYARFLAKLKATATPQAVKGVVWKALFAEHGHVLLWTGLLKLVHDLIMFSPPYILEQLLKHIAAAGSRRGSFGLACALFAAALLENITINIYFHALYRLSLHVKIAMIQGIYEKSLRITGAVKAERGVGSIVNLQSNDAAKIWNMPLYIHVLWNGPFQILAILGLLVRIMGWLPAMAGLGITIVMIPLSTLIGKALAKLRRVMVKETDARIKLASEIITGIKAIKLYAWEQAYMSRVAALRDHELVCIRRTQLLSMMNMALFNSGPILVALAAFSVHQLQGKPLTAAAAFPALALFNLLRFPIIMLPSQVMNMVNARVAITRIQKFLEADELVPHNPSPAPPSATDTHNNPFLTHSLSVLASDRAPLLLLPPVTTMTQPHDTSVFDVHLAATAAAMGSSEEQAAAVAGEPAAIAVCSGTFAWDTMKEPVVRELDLTVEQGALVMVVGQVGAGKSSLLHALLGEMHRVSGRVQMAGSIAYTSQDPWIQNTTLRNNVLLGRRLDEDLYTTVLAACELGPDLEMLPAGDNTEIGEKGVNLSGGQKHRVALARACYAEADVYLLDDPLSAVDAHVGRHLFDLCVCGLLAGRTRVLVTHQLQYLPNADLVLVMADGRVRERGTYTELLDRGVDLHQFVKKSSEENGADATGSSDKPPKPAKHVPGKHAPGDMAGGCGGHAKVTFGSSPFTTPLCKPAGEDALGADSAAKALGNGNGNSVHVEMIRFNADADERNDQPSDVAALGERGNGPQPSEVGAATCGSEAPSSSQPFHTANGNSPAASTPTQHLSTIVPLGSAAAQPCLDCQHTSGSAAYTSGTPLMGGGDGLSPVPLRTHFAGHGRSLSVVRSSVVLLNGERSATGSPGGGGGQPMAAAALLLHGMLSTDRTQQAMLRQQASRAAMGSARASLKKALSLKEADGRITKAEDRATGQVDRAIYRAYLDAWLAAWALLPLVVVLLAFGERGMQVGQNYVLSLWTNDVSRAQQEGTEVHTNWLALYLMLGMLSIGLQLIRSLALVTGSISASRRLHESLLSKVVRLPMGFYDSQPTGRLLNRLTKDTESVDLQLSSSVNMALNGIVNAVLSVLVVSIVTPVALAALLPLGYLYYRVQALYIASTRELKRLDSINFSPIFQHFGESLHGLATIRAFNKQQLFLLVNQDNIDTSNRAYWPIQVVNRWLSVRLELMGGLIVWATAVAVTVVMPGNAGLSGLAITSALNLTNVMNWMVRQMTELEVNMNSVERMVEYLKYDEEAPAVIESRRPPPSWPSKGEIEACALSVRYRPELEPVLKGISFTIYSREKIGVCGRTGCGKSTLMITLYRLVEPCGGSILIDGLDITSIGLRDLRSKLSLVPQDPVIFSGTIRSNLDPFEAFKDDADVWEALRRAGVDEYVRSQEGGLQAPIKESGANLSVGQRQLLCMARALLRASRILVLDEATSNVDNATDSLIQGTIRSAFVDCTVLTIAHRLHTIIDSDRVLLLNAGEVAEFDSPHRLLQRPDSAFRGLVEETIRGGGLNSGIVQDVLDGALRAAADKH